MLAPQCAVTEGKVFFTYSCNYYQIPGVLYHVYVLLSVNWHPPALFSYQVYPDPIVINVAGS